MRWRQRAAKVWIATNYITNILCNQWQSICSCHRGIIWLHCCIKKSSSSKILVLVPFNDNLCQMLRAAGEHMYTSCQDGIFKDAWLCIRKHGRAISGYPCTRYLCVCIQPLCMVRQWLIQLHACGVTEFEVSSQNVECRPLHPGTDCCLRSVSCYISTSPQVALRGPGALAVVRHSRWPQGATTSAWETSQPWKSYVWHRFCNFS